MCPQFSDYFLLGRLIRIDPRVIVSFEDVTVKLQVDDAVKDTASKIRVLINNLVSDTVIRLWAYDDQISKVEIRLHTVAIYNHVGCLAPHLHGCEGNPNGSSEDKP